jgi:hypothetical protein
MTIVVRPGARVAVHTFALPVVREIPPVGAPLAGAAW